MKSNIDIIQVSRSEKVFKKTNYTANNRAEFWNSSNVIESEIGYLNKSLLVLPIKHQNILNFDGCELIILTDGKGFRHNSKTSEIQLFRGVESPKEVELFTLQKIKSDAYELSLNFKNNSWIGIPKRNNHKICNLIIGQNVGIN